MSIPLLATKLYAPPPRPQVVLRSRLIERLNDGLHRKLTLISAPAGFGKTTLVSDWLHDGDDPVGWLSLDEGDNDPTRFLTYLVAALQTVVPQIADAIMPLLQAARSPSPEVVLTALLNQLATRPEKIVLVLDDYHVIESMPVDQALAFLLEYLPPRMHLVIISREDPQLPLARLRVRDQLTELRAADLRFTATEAVEFLNQVMGLNLSPADALALEGRTEGWIAGLQLAALSMTGRANPAQFVREFTGDNRYIVDYLVDEVLQRQPESIKNFLLQTAILDRMNGDLCDAVTRQENSRERLEALERGNFFLVPLDDRRHWYRYHHLFADVLAAHLIAEQPDQVALLHRRASIWYEQNRSMTDAIRHALTAQDFDRAADLIERTAPSMHQTRQESAAFGWFRALPDQVFHNRPVLNILYVGTLLSSGNLKGVETRLRDVEKLLATIEFHEPPNPSMSEIIVSNADEFQRLPGWVAVYRAGYALATGSVPDTIFYARRALDLVTSDDFLQRGAAASLLGLAAWTIGDLETAYRSYTDGMAALQMAENIHDVVGGALALADIRIAQGHLREAMRIYERALALATEHGESEMRGTADMYVGMSDLYREWGDLDAARHQLERSDAQGEHTGFPQNPYRWRVAMARILEAEGDLDGALAQLQDAERVYVGDFYPNVRPVAALKARLWIAQGRLGDALDWSRTQSLSADDDLSYLREFEHVTLARILLAQYQRDGIDHALLSALSLLERLLQAAEAGERTRSVIEILVLQSLANQMRDDAPAALALLERALTLAEPEGYIRLIVDEGAAVAVLLDKAAKQRIAPTYVRQLLKAFGGVEARNSTQGLLDPLSDRERDVLRLLATDLSGPEIARELIVSLNTLRTHTKNIYDKLGVNNRRAAVHRAQALGLL